MDAAALSLGDGMYFAVFVGLAVEDPCRHVISERVFMNETAARFASARTNVVSTAPGVIEKFNSNQWILIHPIGKLLNHLWNIWLFEHLFQYTA